MNISYMQRCVIKIIGPHVASGSASVVPAVSGWFLVKVECHSPQQCLSTVISLLPFQSMQSSTVHTGLRAGGDSGT